MYDSFIPGGCYRSLKSRIAELYYYTTSDDILDELKNDIQEAYDDGEISGTQYDNLIGELQNLEV